MGNILRLGDFFAVVEEAEFEGAVGEELPLEGQFEVDQLQLILARHAIIIRQRTL